MCTLSYPFQGVCTCGLQGKEQLYPQVAESVDGKHYRCQAGDWAGRAGPWYIWMHAKAINPALLHMHARSTSVALATCDDVPLQTARSSVKRDTWPM